MKLLMKSTCKTLICSMFLLMIMMVWLETIQAQPSKNLDLDDNVDDMKQMRRSEVSKALLLLKKHSVVGSDAKIVLKNNGRHLLVDPSERIRVVTNHLSSKSRKSFKLKDNKNGKKDKTHKRSSRNNKSSNNHHNHHNHHQNNNKASRSIPTTSTQTTSSMSSSMSSSSSSQSSQSIESVQRSIMRKAASHTPDVIDSLMGSQMLKDITQFITTIVRNKQAGSLVELSDMITETLNERYGSHWHTISVASPKEFPEVDANSNNELLIDSILANQNQLTSLTHVAVDDHQKSAIFYATFDFGRTLRIFIFK